MKKPAMARFHAVLVAAAILVVSSPAAGQNGAGGNPAGKTGAPSLSVLFVGNSLTYVNDLPTLTQQFAAASALHASLVVWSVTSGGASLAEHWKRGDAVRVLRLHRPDVLVLQGQSTEPLTARDEFLRYAGLLKSEADQIGARTILFETWARPAGDGFYSVPASGGSPAGMQLRLKDTYEWAARRLDAECAAVGQAFEFATSRVPGVPLLDGTQHPTMAGSYLAAAVLFQSLFHASPVGASFTGGLSEKSAMALQGAALAVR